MQRIERKKEEKEKLKLQHAEDEKKVKEKKPDAANTKVGESDPSTPADGGAAVTGEEKSINVKTEDASGVKTEAPSVTA